jgi:CRP-like cAMP-binding protein
VTRTEAAKIVRSVLCRTLTLEQTDQILKAMVPVAAEPGTAVVREGERGRGLLVLLEGSVEVRKQDRHGGDVAIAVIEAPTVLGEMNLLTDRPHSATVRAVTSCEFQLLTRSQFSRLLGNESLAAYKVVAALAEVIARRLDRMDEKFVELAGQGDAPPDD